MGHDESAVFRSVLRKPQHRADCSDFYCNPDDAHIGFYAPLEIVDALEADAQRTGRTWNEQMMYVIHVCQGRERVSPDDERTPNDWRTFMAETTLCLDGTNWIPFLYPPQGKDGDAC
jgi:hypothetical protein